MAKSVNDDETKIMDVSKPGKGKIVSTSRPVVAPVTSSKDEAPTSVPTTEAAQPLSPSATHKVIQPLSNIEVRGDEEIEKPETTPEAEVKAASDDEAEEKNSANEKVEPEETKPEDNPQQGSEAASVDALAGAAEAKKLAAKEAEASLKHDAEIQELIDSKKYVVPIGSEGTHKNHKKHEALVIIIILLITAIAGLYLAIDAELLDLGVEVPFELIKQ